MSLSKEKITTESTTFQKEETVRSNEVVEMKVTEVLESENIKVSVQPPQKVTVVAEVTIPITLEKEKEFNEKKLEQNKTILDVNSKVSEAEYKLEASKSNIKDAEEEKLKVMSQASQL